MNYDELKQQVYKLSDANQRFLFYKLLGWFEVDKDNAEFIRAMESCIKELKVSETNEKSAI